MLTFVFVLPGELIFFWAAKSLWGLNSTVYFTLLGLAALPLLLGLLAASVFQSVTRLPGVIAANAAALATLVKTDIPDVSTKLKQKAGKWAVAKSAARVFAKLWQVQDEMLGGNVSVFSAMLMAGPLFWIVYGFALAGCVVMSVVLLLALLAQGLF